MPYPTAFAVTVFNYGESRVHQVNWDAYIEELFAHGKIQYICAGEETAPSTGRKHLQMYVQTKGPMRASTVVNELKKQLAGDFHVETARGTDEHNYQYCKKEGGTFVESGERQIHAGAGQQGQRSDFVRAYREIVDLGKTAAEVVLANPEAHAHDYKYLNYLEDIALQGRYRSLSSMPSAEWWFGATGTGKTRAASEVFRADPKNVYWWSYDNGWWDSYTGQKTIIFNELRTFPYATMLEITDMHPCNLPRRGRARVPCMAERIIVTSSLRPEEVYNNLSANDKIEQLLRRFKLFHFLSYDNRVEILSPN